ncbi:MAG: hypothetical protein QXP13_01900 [Candidatus Methanomethylicia archaeon]
MSRKRRKSIFDSFFDDSWFDEWEKMFKKFEEMSIGSGYSISITQTPEGTEIHVKAGEDVDVEDLKRDLERKYPGAKIIIEGGRKAREIVEIKEESKEEVKEVKKVREKESIISDILPRKGADIRIIEEDEEDLKKRKKK